MPVVAMFDSFACTFGDLPWRKHSYLLDRC
jgi:hypothetical protein